jgi:hypothetical protein
MRRKRFFKAKHCKEFSIYAEVSCVFCVTRIRASGESRMVPYRDQTLSRRRVLCAVQLKSAHEVWSGGRFANDGCTETLAQIQVPAFSEPIYLDQNPSNTRICRLLKN